MKKNLGELIEQLMSEQDIKELLTASDHNEDYNYNKDGLKVEIKHTDNSKTIFITYDNPTEEIKNNFISNLENISDEDFIAICEFIGKEELNHIQNLIDSNNQKDVEDGINIFKRNVYDYVEDIIKHLTHLKLHISKF